MTIESIKMMKALKQTLERLWFYMGFYKESNIVYLLIK